jgi:hypothetical protein
MFSIQRMFITVTYTLSAVPYFEQHLTGVRTKKMEEFFLSLSGD